MIDLFIKELEEIVLKEQKKEIIPFLQKLSFKDRKALVPSTKKFKEKIFETYSVEEKSKWGLSYTSKNRHTDTKRDLITKVCFVCYNKTDFKKSFWDAVKIATSNEYLEEIIPWYVPNWYNALINEESSWSLDYNKMMLLYKQSLITPSNTLVVTKLPNAIIKNETINGKYTNIYVPEVLENYPETLEEHIWMLFEEESTINNYYNYLHLINYKKGHDVWIDTLINLSDKNKLDRKRLLKTTIYTATKGFNQSLSGWFYDLLIKLNPTDNEVLEFQEELFSALNSPHSKVVNTVLKFFKKVVAFKGFKQKIYIDNCSVLLSSETKSVVNSALMILDKIAKNNTKLSKETCLKATEALLNVDDKIQLRASKIIQKYGTINNDQLKKEINLYAKSLFFSSKEILKDYIEEENEEDFIEEEPISTDLLSEENRVDVYETFDELLFFVSQILDNNAPYHIDLFLNNAPKLNLLLTADNVSKLEPIFKRALDLTFSFSDWNSQIGQLEYEVAFYLNDFSEILMKKFPKELQNFKKYKVNKIQKLKKENFFKSFKGNLKEIELQGVHNSAYQIHHSLLISSKKMIKGDFNIYFLSTPTHLPCWVSPSILVDRIVAYENSSVKIYANDLQIALARIPNQKIEENIANKIEEIKNIEIKEILKYSLNILSLKKATIVREDFWLQAVICKKDKEDIIYFEEITGYNLEKELATYNWSCNYRDYTYKEYDYQKNKHFNKTIQKKEIRFSRIKLEKAKSFSEKLKTFFIPEKSKRIITIYNYLKFKSAPYETTVTPNDDLKFLLLLPNNPEVFLHEIIRNNLKESTFSSETNKKNMVNILKGLHDIWVRKDYQESVYLFLGTSFLCSDKVSRELAGEIWIKAVYQDNFQNNLFGEVLGTLQFNEYAPFKRFTDLLTLNLYNISRKHNESLLVLLDYMIKNMNDKPLRNSKKLIDILLELKQDFKSYGFHEKTQNKLLVWSKTKSLSATIKKII